ncbi:PAAR domain-containing protein [Halomonas sp. TG39a]|uniref:PAAR domain-containing protein n=1 Tax=Halomonas sp. TG39a TaxID=1415755 RepID=UPI00054D1BC3|nr:PAAR domain-containing protein [Halomonas sp. TG39a]
MEQAKLGDQVACSCNGGPHRIVSAASTAFVDGIPVARVGDRSSCGASIVTGLDWYPVEGAAAAIYGSETSCGGVVIAAASAITGQPRGGVSTTSLPTVPPPRYNRRVVFRDEFGAPLAHEPYRLVLEGGDTKEGKTNAQGEADLMDSDLAAKVVDILIRGN